MPPKKGAAVKAPAVDADGEVKFTWTPENERRLLLLAARSSVGGADYREFVKAMPSGVSYEGLRQKFQKLRREQKEIYESMGWTLSDSCPTSNSAKQANKPGAANKGKKRSADSDADADAEGEVVSEKPAKKARVKKEAAAEGETGEEADEKPVKKPAKGRGRAKRGAKVDEVLEEDGPTNDLGSDVKEEAVEEI